MQKWEYLELKLSYDGWVRYANDRELPNWKTIRPYAYLHELGEQGWELAGTLSNDNIGEPTLFLKRPKP